MPSSRLGQLPNAAEFDVAHSHHVLISQRNGHSLHSLKPSTGQYFSTLFLHAHAANPKFGSGFDARAALARSSFRRKRAGAFGLQTQKQHADVPRADAG